MLNISHLICNDKSLYSRSPRLPCGQENSSYWETRTEDLIIDRIYAKKCLPNTKMNEIVFFNHRLISQQKKDQGV